MSPSIVRSVKKIDLKIIVIVVKGSDMKNMLEKPKHVQDLEDFSKEQWPV